MTTLNRPATGIALLIILACPTMVHASFHLMQIQKVIAGVDGDTTAQAIQMRMRSGFQDRVAQSVLVVHDARGANPIVVMDFPSDVTVRTAGSTVLVTTGTFDALTAPTTASDYEMDQPIPASYFAAGSLTFEARNTGAVYWRVSWGGAAYTGPTTGAATNDANGDFGPPFSGPLPTNGLGALEFLGAAGDLSTTNAQDYALSDVASTFTNNAGADFTLMGPVIPGDLNGDGNVNLDDLALLTSCVEGPNVLAPPAGCDPDLFGAGDLSGDSDVDLEDVGLFWSLVDG